jgi:hypothetical protein
LPDGLPIGAARSPALLNLNGEVLAVPRACNKLEFGPCTPVAATLLTDWGSSLPCARGIGLSMDKAHRRLFIACQGEPTVQRDDPATRNKDLLMVMNADSGQVVASTQIGIGTDGGAYDPKTGDVFVTRRDSGDGKNGVIHVFHENSPDKYSKVADVKTIYGARTIAPDPKTHHVFPIATEQNDPVPATPENPYPRPKPLFSSFKVVGIGK